MSFADREKISRGVARGESMRSIAPRLGRPAATISREISRHKGRASCHRRPGWRARAAICVASTCSWVRPDRYATHKQYRLVTLHDQSLSPE
ncbi:helix-turn-helix domain-containing protein [Actinomadura sp. HBU206391]|uniref:helix-turn-helix domain-containing protein n=1 Tax=Actinomadura sp. HBU206391 TaxID=2731692 RepID=UPI001650AE1E|nr:helix-turn-helix domain-containing protein [Actinomadura sp. HBU206391]